MCRPRREHPILPSLLRAGRVKASRPPGGGHPETSPCPRRFYGFVAAERLRTR